ncbi:sensor histidine kinase [Ruminococcus sp.]|uniref:sensor histidine kinase n=1 Tax=Ruminococcus sp. TaxID=41978 RepID=UPI00386BA52C
MTEWGDIVVYTLGGALLMMMAAGIALSALLPALDRWSKRYFITLFSLLLLYVIAMFADAIIYKDPKMAAVENVIYITEYLFFSVLTLMPILLLLHRCSESIKNSVLFRTVVALWIIFLLIMVFAQFTDFIYYTEENNRYYRGPGYVLLLIPLIVIIILNIAAVFRRHKKLSKKYFIGLLVYLFTMTVAVVMHMLIAVDMMVVFGIALCALTMFGFIISDNMEQYMRQQREIAHQRSSVMVLQMRPHFIYNTMMGIYYLCDQDPAKAKQVTLDFTSYLRKNFTAIASEEMIPFNDELEHTRAYLAVEQAQFEDSLFVSFDTPHTMFRVPPLTLQPIVENAVKHGMNESCDPIHISVVTRQTDLSSEIIVNDDGPGFKPTDDDEPHIALNNIRQRLELMCGGTLEVAPREGGGTSVKVTIPIPDK